MSAPQDTMPHAVCRSAALPQRASALTAACSRRRSSVPAASSEPSPASNRLRPAEPTHYGQIMESIIFMAWHGREPILIISVPWCRRAAPGRPRAAALCSSTRAGRQSHAGYGHVRECSHSSMQSVCRHGIQTALRVSLTQPLAPRRMLRDPRGVRWPERCDQQTVHAVDGVARA